jgi:hypothetical protein
LAIDASSAVIADDVTQPIGVDVRVHALQPTNEQEGER